MPKSYGLRDFSLTLRPGLLGLVGPNGAGKTTLMRILATLMAPDEGQVTWDGQDIHPEGERLRRKLGYLPQDFGVYPELTVRQFLQYLTTLKGLTGHRGSRNNPAPRRRTPRRLRLPGSRSPGPPPSASPRGWPPVPP